MKILMIDIETSPNLAHVWGLWQQNVGLSQLLESTEMMCFAAKFLGDKRTQFYSTFHHGRAEMVQKAWDLMNEADVVMGWNSKSFDEKHLNREFLEAGLRPPSPVKSLDLMHAVKRKFRLPSNKLQYVSTLLGTAGKVQHEGHELWIKCLAGDQKAWSRMRKYNIQDVDLLQEVYEQLLPWIDGHPSVALYDDAEQDSCGNCGSTALKREGYAFTKLGKFQRFVCETCGKWGRSGRRIGAVDIREVAA
jgi:DNA polymerase elongation subunit (family B)